MTRPPCLGPFQDAAVNEVLRLTTKVFAHVAKERGVDEVQGAILVAQERPRNEVRAIEKMRETCGRYALAERAFFKFPRGGENVTGASVHLARELARIWGNISYGVKELARSDARGESEMLAYAWDLETNARPETAFIVPHARDTKKGVKPLTDMRDIYENNANMGARRLRECIFAVLPKWFTDEAEDMCRETLEKGKDNKPLPQRIADMVSTFEGLGVTCAMIEKREQKSVDKLAAMDVAQLGVLYRSIRAGEISKDEAFPESLAADVGKALQDKAAGQAAVGGTVSEKPAAVQTQVAGPTPSPTPSPTPTPGPANVDYDATLRVIQQRMVKAGSLQTVEATVTDFAEELDMMRTEAPDQYAQAMEAINGKRAAFKG